jgi:hypothetical protein
MISDALIVFDGIPGKNGRAQGPFSLHEGMNKSPFEMKSLSQELLQNYRQQMQQFIQSLQS